MHRHAALLLLLPLAVAACGGGSASTRRFADAGAPLSFTYPKGFARVFADTGREIRGRPPTFRVAVGTDETNVIVVSTYRLSRPVETYSPKRFATLVDDAVSAIAQGTDMRVTRQAAVRLGKLPATGYWLQSREGGVGARFVLAFRDRTEYFLRCQWDARGSARIGAACDRAAGSFALRD